MWIFSTKYCLTTGIEEIEATIKGAIASVEKTSKCYAYSLHTEGKEWHRTREAAVERAEEVRINKLKSLDKSTKKISALTF